MLVSGRVIARSSYSESCLRGLFGSKKQRSIPMTRPAGMQPGFSPYLIPLHSTWKYLTLQESAKKYLCPKYHQISKLVVWRSQNPAIQSQTPLCQCMRDQRFLGYGILTWQHTLGLINSRSACHFGKQDQRQSTIFSYLFLTPNICQKCLQAMY